MQNARSGWLGGALLIVLSACASPPEPAPTPTNGATRTVTINTSANEPPVPPQPVSVSADFDSLPVPSGAFNPYAPRHAATLAQSCPGGRQDRATLEGIRIDAAQAPLGETRVGDLVFRGGIELTSPDKRFGGLSGLEIVTDLEGPIAWAVSDTGTLFRFRLIEETDGRLAGVYQNGALSLTAPDGTRLTGKRAADAEGLALAPGGALVVSFEHDHRLGIVFPAHCGSDGALVETGDVSGAAIPDNGGAEALAYWPVSRQGGFHTLIGGIEEASDGAVSMFQGLSVFGGIALSPDSTALKLPEGFGLTGVDVIGDTAFILQRAYDRERGNRIRILRHDLDPDGAWGRFPDERSTLLAELAKPLAVDNFEGIAALARRDGSIRLYLLSDNNFSGRQRTLLYAFDYRP